MLAFCPSCRRRFRLRSLNDDQMGLHDRELSPLSSNDIGDKISRSKVNDMPNHFNKSMKRSVTDTIREQLENDLDMPIMSVQKPAYIPGEIGNCCDNNRCSLEHPFRVLQLNVLTRPIIKSPSWAQNIKIVRAIITNRLHQHPAKVPHSSLIPRI